MTAPRTAADYLVAGDLTGLLAHNAALYGDAEMMAGRGIAVAGDVRVLSDGTDLNAVWNEFQQTIELANQNRSALVSLLSFRTSNSQDVILQSPTGTAEFEKASELGVPQSSRAEVATQLLGYSFDFWDLAARYSWQFLAKASLPEVQALHNGALAAHNRLEFRTVLGALFNNTNRTHPETDAPIKALWNADGSPIPAYNGNTFDPNLYSMYATTGTASLTDPKDVEEMVNQVLSHGYGDSDGAKLVVLANRQEADAIAGWRAGVGGAAFDFVPSDTSIPYLSTETLIGQRPPGNFQGMKVSGQYGPAYIAPTSLIPAGYMAAVAVGGPTPVVGLREHVRPEYRGLKIIRGTNPDYPITEAYYVAGIGVGVRQRGAAAIRQVTASGTYTPPVFA